MPCNKRARFKRVGYAKTNIPRSMMEYRIVEVDGKPVQGGPVGTRKEIRAWAKKHNVRMSELEIKEEKEY